MASRRTIENDVNPRAIDSLDAAYSERVTKATPGGNFASAETGFISVGSPV
jgi:hypothetical protein